MSGEYHIYVDGSWREGRIGYAAIILQNDQVVKEIYGPISPADAEGTRQVAGELFAVGKAVQWCQQQGIGAVHLYYDYYGIEKWATGEWKAKLSLTQRYKQFIQHCGIRISWHKVESHSGNYWNEQVDKLAKMGAAGERSG